MSSDFEQLLRDAREALPVPDEPASGDARRRSVATVRRKRTRARLLVLVGTMIVLAVALGVTAGSLNAPSVTAAREPAVLGFVPEPGWFALQSPPPAVEGQQTVAVAANVPFAADDVRNGLVEPSGLPYSTLLTLPPDGIVIVTTMVPQSVPHVAPVPTDPLYPKAELPLRLRDALPVFHWGAQVRPDQPTAQYHLRAHLHGYDVTVVVYFGTPRPSEELLREAQRQLSGFVVRSEGVDASRPASLAAPSGPVAVIDRTFECNTMLLGGLYQIEVRSHAGHRLAGRWSKLPYAAVSTGGNGGRPDTSIPPVNLVAWVSAGAPTRASTVDDSFNSFTVQAGGTLGRNVESCRPSRASVALSRAGLRGGEIRSETRAVDCDAPRHILVRVRATTLGSAALHERAGVFAATGTTISHAELAVGRPGGRLLAYAIVDQSGRSRQFTAPRGCVREP